MVLVVEAGCELSHSILGAVLFCENFRSAQPAIFRSLDSVVGRKHGALHPQKPLRLIRDGKVGGSGIFIFNTYSLHSHHQNDSALRWARCVSHFNVSLIVWAKSQDKCP